MFDKLKQRIKAGVREWRRLLTAKNYSPASDGEEDDQSNNKPEEAVESERQDDESRSEPTLLSGIDSEELEQAKISQYLRFIALVIVFITIAATYFSVEFVFGPVKRASKDQKQPERETAKIELATESIKGASKWQSYFEDKIEEEKNLVELQIKSLKQVIDDNQQQQQEYRDRDSEELTGLLAQDELNTDRFLAFHDDIKALKQRLGQEIVRYATEAILLPPPLEPTSPISTRTVELFDPRELLCT